MQENDGRTMPASRSTGRPSLPSHRLVVRGASNTPGHMRRVVFDLPDGFDYAPGQALVTMIPLGDGTFGRRDYTIRSIDREEGTLSIDFFIHADTPGPLWAQQAKAGNEIDVRGPRGRTVFDASADWHLMTGDETGLPAIAHILETVPQGTRVFAFIEVATLEDRVEIDTHAALELIWLSRDGAPAGPSSLMSDAVAGWAQPEGRGKAYIIGETSNVRAQRRDLVARGMERADILSEGYWRPGRIGGHDHVDD